MTKNMAFGFALQPRHKFKFKLNAMGGNNVTVLIDGKHTFSIRIIKVTFSLTRGQRYKTFALIFHGKTR
jgi:hypothetical protein